MGGRAARRGRYPADRRAVSMRALVRRLDGLLRRANGVFEFCTQEDCVLRLQLRGAPHQLHLSDGVEVRAGDPVVMIHLWNEHVPPLGPDGPDLAWASRMGRMLLGSYRAVARWLADQPRMANVRAVGGVTVLISPHGGGGSLRLMQRLGFEVLPYHVPLGHPLGRFGEFWENLYTWWLMWAYNAASLRHRRLLRLCRTEFWMSARAFLERYGRSPS
jgi:hypothetical protein